MAYTTVQSGEIPEGTQYYSGKLPLGDYNFYLKIDATGVSPKIVAQCESPDGTMRTAASRTWPAGTQVQGWSVEANETEASVYVSVKYKDLDTGPVNVPFSYGSNGVASGLTAGSNPGTIIWTWSCDALTFAYATATTAYMLFASDSPGTIAHGSYTNSKGDSGSLDIPLSSSFSYQGKTVYYSGGISSPFGTLNSLSPDCGNGSIVNLSSTNMAAICWIMVYGNDTDKDKQDNLVARFAIDLGDAGGYPGGGGGWTQPGDWNSDPTTTLHLTVNGALSGRHNDPLEHPIYSYLPADNTTEAGYGCGGDGGHGGGGGGGASTIIVRQFATNKANSKDIVTIAKRHGYGSGAGKGAKGGDGCILVYY